MIPASQVLCQEIFQAIKEGDADSVKSILEQDDKMVHLEDKDKDTPLHYAAVHGRGEIIELLIANGALVNARNYQGYTPLHWAASRGRIEAARALLANGAGIDLKNQRGRTPLFLVAMNSGNASLAEMLIAAGADVNTQENGGGTPISYAAFRGYSDLIDLLLDNGAEVQTDTVVWYEVFHRACAFGNQRLADVMLEKGLDIDRRNEDGRLPLHSAAEGGALELVTLLAKRGNPVSSRDYFGDTPLHLAAASGHADVVEKLIELDAAIDAKNVLGERPFNLASRNDHEQVMQLLIEKGADQSPPRFPVIKGKYLGQEKPGTTPEVFGPGLVSGHAPVHGSVTFTPDGKEMYWSVVDFEKRGSTVYGMKMKSGRWSKPRPPSFASEYSDDVPFVSPDGKRLYFLSNRPLTEGGVPGKENIWFIEREGADWGNARPLGPAVNSMDLHWQFSLTSDATIYFGTSEGTGKGLNDIFRSELKNGKYQEPENLGDAINTEHADFAPYISPDESFLIFTSRGRPDGSGLFISFRGKDGTWTQASYLGETIGSEALLTTFSPDGKYLFFTGRREGRKGVFWVDAGIIEEPEPEDDR